MTSSQENPGHLGQPDSDRRASVGTGDDSVGKSTRCKACTPEFHPRPHKRDGKQQPHLHVVILPTDTLHTWICACAHSNSLTNIQCKHTCTQCTHTYTQCTHTLTHNATHSLTNTQCTYTLTHHAHTLICNAHTQCTHTYTQCTHTK